MNRLWSRTAAIEFPPAFLFEPAWYWERWPWFAGVGGLLFAFWLGRVSRRGAAADDGTEGSEAAAQEGALATLAERLTSLGRQQESLGRSLNSLEGVLADKQARGAFGEVQLERLVADLLPPAGYRLQAPLGRNRVDCLIHLPWPPGPVPVDAKFPLEAYQAWQVADTEAEAARALRLFARDVARHVEAIRGKYLIPGQTADFALLFMPSEAVFSALHTHCREAVEAAQRARVFPVSPSTLWPLLNTLAAVLRDVRMTAQAQQMQVAFAELGGQSDALAGLARKTERDWSSLATDLQRLIAAADSLAAAGRALGAPEPGERSDGGQGPGVGARGRGQG